MNTCWEPGQCFSYISMSPVCSYHNAVGERQWRQWRQWCTVVRPQFDGDIAWPVCLLPSCTACNPIPVTRENVGPPTPCHTYKHTDIFFAAVFHNVSCVLPAKCIRASFHISLDTLLFQGRKDFPCPVTVVGEISTLPWMARDMQYQCLSIIQSMQARICISVCKGPSVHLRMRARNVHKCPRILLHLNRMHVALLQIHRDCHLPNGCHVTVATVLLKAEVTTQLLPGNAQHLPSHLLYLIYPLNGSQDCFHGCTQP